MPRGNVLFITVDQWRGDCLSALDHPVVRTPTLDALAARGVLFANHWANVAPCGPSRATLHTGLYAQNHRSVLNGTPLDDRFATTPRLAREAGYDPVLFGYTDTSVDPRTLPAGDPALTTYEGVLPDFTVVVNDPEETLGSAQWGRWLAEQGVDVPANPRDLYQPDRSFPGADRHGDSWAPTRFAAEHTETAFVMEHLLDWLERNGDEPWFVHASFIRPHPPYRNPAGYHDRYSADDGPGFRGHATPEEAAALHPLAQVMLSIPLAAAPVDEGERRQLRATYWGMMAEVDDQLARLFDWLQASGQGADTLVVLTSDHGDQMGDHWLVEKLGWWDESYSVPLVVVDPRPEAEATRGSVVRAVTEHVDVLPTLCEWMGVEVPVQCDGRALQPFLHGDGATPADWRRAAHWEWDFRHPLLRLAEGFFGVPSEHCVLNVVREEHRKYVHFALDPDLLPPLAFDLEADPEQCEDLAGTARGADIVGWGRDALLTWRMRHDERTLTGWLLTPGGPVVHYDPRR